MASRPRPRPRGLLLSPSPHPNSTPVRGAGRGQAASRGRGRAGGKTWGAHSHSKTAALQCVSGVRVEDRPGGPCPEKHFINKQCHCPFQADMERPFRRPGREGQALGEGTPAGQDLLSLQQTPREPGWRSGVGVWSQRTPGLCEPSWGRCVGSELWGKGLGYAVGSHSWEQLLPFTGGAPR